MRRRRRLADKLTIMVCAVLVAVSAFFYAPMEVSAEESLIVSPKILKDDTLYTDVMPLSIGNSVTPLSRYFASISVKDSVTYNFSNYLDDGNGLYKVIVNFKTLYNSGVSSTYWRAMTTLIDVSGSRYAHYVSVADASATCSSTDRLVFYVNSSSPTATVHYRGNLIWTSLPASTVSVDCSYSVSVVSAEKVTASDSEQYQNGYNAGYADGVSVGYGNGYSEGFADGEASVDTDSIYDEAFRAGKDSVDIDSYYDAGYQAGYQVAYSDGYESGYDEGYQSAMDRIDGWGADTSQYPKYISGSIDSDGYIEWLYVDWSEARDVNLFEPWYDWFTINPNHTYKVVVNLKGTRCGHNYNLSPSSFSTLYVYFEIGGVRYALPTHGETCEIFIPGDRMSTTYGLGVILEGLSTVIDSESEIYFAYDSCDISVYDMGPSGDTQNHIANQTDSLTNGFDNSQGNSVNNDLSSGLNEYQTSEDTLWATATTGLKDFTFFDFASVPAMITGMSFITAIMGSWFNQAGGASGVGIVLSILFSVVLVAMVLGLYRWYQSRGGKD